MTTYTVTVDSPDWEWGSSPKWEGLDKDTAVQLVMDQQLAQTQPLEVKVFHFPPRTTFFCFPPNNEAPLIINLIKVEG